MSWLEDCTPAKNQDALRLVRQHTTTLLAIGEVFNSATAQPTPSQWLSHQRNTGSLTTGTVALPERNIYPKECAPP